MDRLEKPNEALAVATLAVKVAQILETEESTKQAAWKKEQAKKANANKGPSSTDAVHGDSPTDSSSVANSNRSGSSREEGEEDSSKRKRTSSFMSQTQQRKKNRQAGRQAETLED